MQNRIFYTDCQEQKAALTRGESRSICGALENKQRNLSLDSIAFVKSPADNEMKILQGRNPLEPKNIRVLHTHIHTLQIRHNTCRHSRKKQGGGILGVWMEDPIFLRAISSAFGFEMIKFLFFFRSPFLK